MISPFTCSMAVIVMSTTAQAYWVPDEAYVKRQQPEPSKSEDKGATKTTAKKEPTSKPEPSNKKDENSKAASATSKKPSSTQKSNENNKSTSISNSGSSSAIVPTFVATTPATSSPSVSPAPTTSSSSSTGPIIGGVIAGIVAIVGIVAFMLFRRRKARQQARQAHLKPDPFTMGFGNDDYNNNFPPQQSNYQSSSPKKETATFDHYEVAPITNTNPIITPTPAPVPAAPAVDQQPTLGSYVVIATYIPTLSDELEIETGDKIELVVEYDDGWCQGINLSKGYTKGVFPRHCIDFDHAKDGMVPPNKSFDVERSKRVSSMYKP